MTVEHHDPYSPASRPRRLSLKPVALVIVLLAVVAAIVGTKWLQSYAPLAAGSSWNAGPNVLRHVPSEDDLYALAVGRDAAVLDFESGEPFTFSMTVANTGGLPVRLEGIVPSFDGWEGPMFIDGLRLGTRDNALGEPEQVPFHPVTIEPGDELEINVVGHFQGECQPPTKSQGSAAVMHGIDLRYSYAGIFERTQAVGLHEDVAVVCSVESE